MTIAKQPPIKSKDVECPRCGRPVSGSVPKGGDGSLLRVRKHLDRATELWCLGSGELTTP